MITGQTDLLEELRADIWLSEGREYIQAEEARDPDTDRPLTCPWCGYGAVTTAWHMKVYHCWQDQPHQGDPGACLTMILVRNHALAALRQGKDETDKRIKKKVEPRSFNEYMEIAATAWGERAREFIPPEYYPEHVEPFQERKIS